MPDEAVIDEHLPELPQLPPSTLKPPLAHAPVPVREGQSVTARDNDRPFVTVVSGLPRSGTSMMMQMLAAGGLPLLTDETREADQSNPRGYFELEKVKQLPTDNTWLHTANGKAVKVVAPLVPFLPQECSYRLVFMRRELDEVVSSQRHMLERLEREGAKLSDTRLRQVMTRQLQQATQLLKAHGVPVLTVSYSDTLERTDLTAKRVAEFLELDLDQDAMQRAVDPTLHRERSL